MNKNLLTSALLLAPIFGCSGSVDKVNKRTASNQIADASSNDGYKLLSNVVSISNSSSLNLVSSFPAASVTAAVGRVTGCVEEASVLAISGMDLSIQVPFDCSNEVILLDSLDLAFSGFNGVVQLKQGLSVFVNEEYGSVVLNNLNVVRIGGTIRKSANIEIGGKELQSSITIDGSDSACNDLQIVQNGSNIDLQLTGDFPLAAQNVQSENLVFVGATSEASATKATFRAVVPEETGTAIYSGKLSWNETQINKFCSFNAIVEFSSSAATNVLANEEAGCAFASEQLWNQEHINYCTYDRLSAVEVPSICAEGKKLLITTVLGSSGEPIITLAMCQ